MAIRIGDLLVQHGIITQQQLHEALHNQQIFGGRLGTNVVELGYVSEATLAKVLSEQLQIPCAEAREFDSVAPEVLALIPAELAGRYKIVPLSLDSRNLRLAMSDPTDLRAVDEIGFTTGKNVVPMVAPEMLIVYALEKFYNIPRGTRYLHVSGVASAEFEVVEVAGHQAETPGAKIKKVSSLQEASQQLAKAQSHDDLFELLRSVLAHDFGKGVVFVFRGQLLACWSQVGYGISNTDLRKISIPLEGSAFFRTVCQSRAPFVGRPKLSDTDSWLLRAAGISIPHDVLCVPVLVNNQPVALLFAVESQPGHAASLLEHYDTLAKKVSYAVQMLFFRKRILE